MPVIAAALVDGIGLFPSYVTERGFTTAIRLGPGLYQLGLDAPAPPDDNCIVNVTLNTRFSIPINIDAQVAGGQVFVAIIAPLAVPLSGIDARFYVTVTSNF